MSHSVSVSPASIDLTPGGAPVVATITVSGVPADVSVSQPFTVTVGADVVAVNTTVTVDKPEPAVADPSASPGDYTVAYASPVQDAGDASVWTVEATFTPA